MAKAKTSKRSDKPSKKRHVTEAIAHVYATFNNTIITLTDKIGNVLTTSSAGACGFKGSRKSTPFAAQSAVEAVTKIAQEQYGVQELEIWVKGPGAGRESAIRSLGQFFKKVVRIIDKTPLAHNGCRPPKVRRV